MVSYHSDTYDSMAIAIGYPKNGYPGTSPASPARPAAQKAGPVITGNGRGRRFAPIMAEVPMPPNGLGNRCHTMRRGKEQTMDQAAWDERYAGPELVWGAGPNCFVATELAGLSPGRALDLGTGEGRNAIWLAERGWQVTGVDFSAVGLGRAEVLARQRGVGVDWVQADLLSYAPAPGGYDLVLIAYIQLPTAELAHLVRAAAAAVAPGGTLLAVGHDAGNLTRGWGGPQYPDVLWTPPAVAAGLDGLTVHRAEQVERHVQTADGEQVAIDTLVRAERPA